MERLNIDRLIGEIARRHNLLLSKDDPILVTVTLNELVLIEALRGLEGAIESARHSMSANAMLQMESAKEIASRIITAAADYADQEIRAAGTAAATDIRDSLKAPQGQASQIILAAREIYGASWWAAATALCSAFIAAGIAVAIPLVQASSITPCQAPVQQHLQRINDQAQYTR